MRILITGGAGFIGSHLTDYLLEQGHQVSIVDDLSTGRIANIAHLKENQAFEFCEGSILNYKLMLRLVTSCDCIYHLAAAVGVKYVVEHPLESLITNVRGTEIVLDLAHVFKKKVFLASSSEVYGKNGNRTFKEDDDRILGAVSIPRWGYSCSKAFDEYLAAAYYASSDLPIITGRLFNICGPRQTGSYGMVIPRFVQQALNQEPITVYGDGNQIRSFTYIDDTVKAIAAMMDKSEAVGEIFNIGGVEAISISELAQKVRAFCNSDSEIINIPYDQAYSENFEDLHYRIPDMSKLNDCLGIVPQVALDEMLKVIIAEHN